MRARWRARRALLIACALCVATAAGRAHADEGGAEEAPELDERSAIERGRALTWGVTAIVPILLSDVRESTPRAIAYLNPGGGVEGRAGFELAHGVALGLTGGVSAFVSENSRALAMYRGGVEARWTIDVGSIVAPSVGLAVGALFVSFDAGIAATAWARLLLGVQVVLAPWAALEAGASIEGALGIDAIADPFAWISPQVGVSFYE